MTLLSMPDHPRAWPALFAAACLGALGSALASQYWGGLYPCTLCIYQRYAYGAALAVAVIAFVVADRPGLRRLALIGTGLAFLAGAGVAAFHVGVEQKWWEGLTACSNPGLPPGASVAELREALMNQPFAPCDLIPWSLFGVSMAGYNVLASAGLAGLALWAALGPPATPRRRLS